MYAPFGLDGLLNLITKEAICKSVWKQVHGRVGGVCVCVWGGVVVGVGVGGGGGGGWGGGGGGY